MSNKKNESPKNRAHGKGVKKRASVYNYRDGDVFAKECTSRSRVKKNVEDITVRVQEKRDQ